MVRGSVRKRNDATAASGRREQRRNGLVQRRVSHNDEGTTLDGYFIATRWANDGIVQTLMTERSLRFLHSRVSCARRR